MTTGWGGWGCVTVQPQKSDLVPEGEDRRLHSLSQLQTIPSMGGHPFDASPSSPTLRTGEPPTRL